MHLFNDLNTLDPGSCQNDALQAIKSIASIRCIYAMIYRNIISPKWLSSSGKLRIVFKNNQPLFDGLPVLIDGRNNQSRSFSRM